MSFSRLENIFGVTLMGESSPNMVVGEKYRISVLTPWLIRFEYQESGCFSDAPTQKILCRNLGKVNFEVQEHKDEIILTTSALVLRYRIGAPTASSLSIVQKKSPDQHTIWYYGVEDKGNLKGTCRTLDDCKDSFPLESGLLSQNGYAIVDDSESLELLPSGYVAPRTERVDLYYFGYGRNYTDCLKDFFRVSGAPPTIDKAYLGNWWSRFWEYDHASFIELADRFASEDTPLAVQILDMDWHLVDIDPAYGSGWTGFTWNRELFPTPQKTLQHHKDSGIKVALNLHPSDGIRAFESAYPAICKTLGLDPEKKLPIPFHVSDPNFMNAYFTEIIDANESIGVDFWWIDWQQGTVSLMEGLDPLWMINHLHYLHKRESQSEGIIFSRYGGLGSQRYPIGFSGDTHITWDVLQFVPYFTATAANVGYNYWSHDIGGHMQGINDDELYVRWTQFGVFSPIFRYHSGKAEYIEKLPWKYNAQVRDIAKEYLRLRHKLIPYMYSENSKTGETGKSLVRPLYHDYPEDMKTYEAPNCYLFGSEMLVAPVTTPIDAKTGLAATQVYLPEGDWYDGEGRRYGGGRYYRVFSKLHETPLFYRSGAIVVQDPSYQTSHLKLSEVLDVHIYPGSSQYTIVFDSGVSDTIKVTDHGGSIDIRVTGNSEHQYSVTLKGREHSAITARHGSTSIPYAQIQYLFCKEEFLQLLYNTSLDNLTKGKITEYAPLYDTNTSSIDRIRMIDSLGIDPDVGDVLREYICSME